ncbi:MAG: hypothetical protein R3E79_61750 [Caldilineaceae bacterium]
MAAQIVQNPDIQHGDSHQVEESSQRSRNSVREHTTRLNAPNAANRTGEPAAAGWNQNPELLQWRANVLLDEMMLGAVDIAASEMTHAVPAPARPVRKVDSTEYAYDSANHATTHHPVADEDTPVVSYPTGYANGFHHTVEHASGSGGADPGEFTRESQSQQATQEERSQAERSQDEWSRPAWHFAEPTTPVSSPPHPAETPSARAVALQEYTRHQTTPTSGDGHSRHTGQRISPPEIRTTAIGAPPRPSQPTAPKAASPKDNGEKSNTEQWVFAAEQRYQQIAARHQTPAPDPTDTLFDDFVANGYEQGKGRPRVNQSIRRSNLLPRMSNLDPHTLQQEMVMLQTEIEEALPAGHESRERALHLLQKAYAILQTDPTRSAEVDYYLQQVRTIGQRMQETLHWSNLYRSRLNAYLVAWIVLSVIILGGHYAYHGSLVAAIASFSGVDVETEPLLPHNLLTAFSAFFGGALGGAVGAFVNARQYARVKQGFFDRKYSLRGLILPLIGGLVGLVLCLFFGIIYYLFALDPAVNLLLGALPAMFALLFGVTQEFIYGTRT